MNYFIVAGVILFVWLLKRFISRYLAGLLYSIVHKIWKDVDKKSFINLVVKPLGLFLAVPVSYTHLGSYPAGMPTNEDTYIVGELYQAKNEHEFSWAIGQLDDYEGVDVEFDEVQLYRREVTEVNFNNHLTRAWIYWYNGDVSGRPVIASGDLMEYMQKKK